MCECMTKVVERAKEHIENSPREKGFKLIDIGWKDQGLILGSPSRMSLYYEMKYEYTFTKSNGDTSSPKSKSINIMLTFCPFCGEKIDKSNDEVDE